MDQVSADIADNCHIYLICRRPACSFDPSTFSYNGENLRGTLVYRLNGKSHALPFFHFHFWMVQAGWNWIPIHTGTFEHFYPAARLYGTCQRQWWRLR